MIIEINVLVDCSDLQPSLIVNLKTMISDARSICDETLSRPGGDRRHAKTFDKHYFVETLHYFVELAESFQTIPVTPSTLRLSNSQALPVSTDPAQARHQTTVARAPKACIEDLK